MKVTINLSDLQILKVLALSSSTEEQAEAVMVAVSETPELNLTEQCQTNAAYVELSLAVAAFAVAAIIQKYKSDTSV